MTPPPQKKKGQKTKQNKTKNKVRLLRPITYYLQ